VSTISIRRVVTTRHGGASVPPYASFNLGGHVGDCPEAVAANRERLATGIGLPTQRLVWMEQVHSRTVTVIDGTRNRVLTTLRLCESTWGIAVDASASRVYVTDPLGLAIWSIQDHRIRLPAATLVGRLTPSGPSPAEFGPDCRCTGPGASR